MRLRCVSCVRVVVMLVRGCVSALFRNVPGTFNRFAPDVKPTNRDFSDLTRYQTHRVESAFRKRFRESEAQAR